MPSTLFTYYRRNRDRSIATLFYLGMLIAYVKANTPSSWLSVFKFSILGQFSTPRSALLFLLPLFSPIAGILILHALA